MAVPFITEVKRTHTCGQLTKANIGKEVVLFGWVQNRRDHGGASSSTCATARASPRWCSSRTSPRRRTSWPGSCGSSACIGIGARSPRAARNVNPKLTTGEIEVKATDLTIFNRSEPPPFPIEDNIDTGEEKRLEYRYLDLRRAPLQQSLMTRSKMNAITRALPGGQRLPRARDAVHGQVHARRRAQLPRALAGSTRASSTRWPRARSSSSSSSWWRASTATSRSCKCFRDEDLRLDRQPEFTQIDVEMCFVTQDDVFTHHRGAHLQQLWKEVLGSI